MSDLLKKLKDSASAIHPVTLNGVKLGLRILNDADFQDADVATLALMKQKGITFATESADTFESEKSIQLLSRALVNPDTGEHIAKSVDDLRTTLNREQRGYLITEYLEFEREHAPREDTMPEEEFTELLESIKKNPLPTLLNDLNSATLKKLILSLASQPDI